MDECSVPVDDQILSLASLQSKTNLLQFASIWMMHFIHKLHSCAHQLVHLFYISIASEVADHSKLHGLLRQFVSYAAKVVHKDLTWIFMIIGFHIAVLRRSVHTK